MKVPKKGGHRNALSKAKPTADKPLTALEQRFADIVIAEPSLNLTEAALKAGYSGKNMNTLRALSCKVRNKANVAAVIAKRAKAASEAADLTAVDMLRELKPLVLSNMADYLVEDPVTGLAMFKPLKDLTRAQLAAISEMTVDTQTVIRGKKTTVRVDRIKFKLYDKHAALVTLGRHLKMFLDTKEPVSVTNNTVVVVQNALSAADEIVRGIIEGSAMERLAPPMPGGPVLPAEVHPSQA